MDNIEVRKSKSCDDAIIEKERMMFTENELTAALEQSESTTPANPPAALDAAFAAIGMEFDPHHFHGEPVDGEAKPEGSASGCPYASFFSGLFGGGNG